MIEKKVKHLDKSEYIPMDHFKIFTNMSHFLEIRNKIAIYENRNEKKLKKIEKIQNRLVFFFEDFIETK